MDLREILDLPRKKALKHIDFLAKTYKEQTGRNVCRFCPSDLTFMLHTLKRSIQMSEFRFKRERAIYRIDQESKERISNDIITDELAIRFLKVNPERISLFSQYPENWEDLISDSPVQDTEDGTPCTECELKEELEAMKMTELREKYGELVKVEFGMKKTEYIDKILEALE